MKHRRTIEEGQRLKDRYGKEAKIIDSDDDSENSSGSTDDDQALYDNDDKHLDFLTTFAKIKSKHSDIYEKEKKFYKNNKDYGIENENEKDEGGNHKKMTLKEFHKGFVKDQDNKDIDDEQLNTEENLTTSKLAYNAEQKRIKDKFTAINDSDSDSEGDMLVKKTNSELQKQQNQNKFLEWMENQKDDVDDSRFEDLKNLKNEWENVENKNDKFLRDYILYKKWQKTESDDDDSSDDGEDDLLISKENSDSKKPENLKERTFTLNDPSDEEADFISKQEKQEVEYNFRHQEDNSNALTSFPRNITSSVKQAVDISEKASKKKLQKQKLEDKKRQKMEDAKLQKKLKKSEIADKLAKIMEEFKPGESTSAKPNDDLDFLNEENEEAMIEKLGINLDEDWDPEKHAELMGSMFDDEYYDNQDIGEDLDVKPEWDDLNAEIENEALEQLGKLENEEEEDEEDEKERDQSTKEESRAERRKREREEKRKRKDKKKSSSNKKDESEAENSDDETANLKAKISSIPDTLLENHPSLKKDLKELDKLNLKSKGQEYFAYRTTEPNNFGLTIDQILDADDKELNKWAPLSKVVAYRNKEEDIKEREYFSRQMEVNKQRRNRVFKTLYDSTTGERLPSRFDAAGEKMTKKKEKKKRKAEESEEDDDDKKDEHDRTIDKKEKVRGKKHKISMDRLETYGIDSKKFREQGEKTKKRKEKKKKKSKEKEEN